ncbi:MAG: thioredoxin family protein [Saprospiraceae bacterium]|nr:thioredoxin family protein [Saprospiraceae bacterium]
MIRLALISSLLLIGTTGFAGQGPEQSAVEFETNAETAFQRARAEGKHVFIVFKATWCTPCRWMETTTFQDQGVLTELATNYIAVEADIDQPDGFVLFYDHQIQVLPTMIILNQEGQVLKRIEESLGPDKLISILNDQAAGLTPVPGPGLQTTGKKAERSEYTDVLRTAPANQATSDRISPPPATGFTVQVGVFTLYPNVLTKVLEINSLSDRTVHLEESEINDVVVYKLMSGHFATRAEAEAWRARLAEAKIPGYIRDLNRS